MTTPDPNHPSDDALDARIAALTRSAEPGETVWTGIDRRIQAPRRAAWPWSAAAAVLLAVAIVAVQPGPERAPTQPDRTVQLVQAEAAAMRRADPVATVDWVDEAPWREAWADNQAAIDELEAALSRDPDNRLLLEFLAEARLRQTRLINSGLVVPTRPGLHSPEPRMTL